MRLCTLNLLWGGAEEQNTNLFQAGPLWQAHRGLEGDTGWQFRPRRKGIGPFPT